MLNRHFTVQRQALQNIPWKITKVPSCPSGVEAPESWSDTAVEIAASKYFRKREGERSIKQMFQRVVNAIRGAGEAQGYFGAKEGEIFADELSYILFQQMASFNSPVYFNVGLFSAYGVAGTGENFVWDEKAGRAVPTTSVYIHPQASACFIQNVRDDLIDIFDLLKSEAKLFKYGSGTGTNFSRLRAKGEPLEGGGESTGLISYLEIFDKSAQAIKSGGTTRRAAKMVVLDADHPDIMDFIRWKMLEERKARVLLANGYSAGMEGEAMRTVSGQNSNNSVRVTDEFINRALKGESWSLRYRRTGKVAGELPAHDLLHSIARAAWECADPGIQFHDTIQQWHTCPRAGSIRSSNPCSEYMFLDDSACNLASINLTRFATVEAMDWEALAQVVRILFTAQDILVDYAAYPTAAIAENSHRYRPLGLGYANLGALLMQKGIPYDSEQAAQWTAKITGALHALTLKVSCDLARSQGAFAQWSENRTDALHVVSMHAKAWRQHNFTDMEWVERLFATIEEDATRYGLRNAQLTLLAPTGTIGLLMDCDTLGIEPDFSLVKRKTLAGGGDFVLVNQSLYPALINLGYPPADAQAVVEFVRAYGTVVGAPALRAEHYPVFDCAMSPTSHSERRVSAQGHLRIMAAAQPFLSGAISKTVNLPNSTTVGEIERLFVDAWRLGLKSLAVYRDGSKATQPLCVEC